LSVVGRSTLNDPVLSKVILVGPDIIIASESSSILLEVENVTVPEAG
jgi:hypothetical protein